MRNRGQFRPGPDPRRHRFTRDECVAGFWAALTSISVRYPDAIDSSGRHMACKFLASRSPKKAKAQASA
jgi:hypothetical protein